eukprot:6394826-Pyramimonas_sp.AAC.1
MKIIWRDRVNRVRVFAKGKFHYFKLGHAGLRHELFGVMHHRAGQTDLQHAPSHWVEVRPSLSLCCFQGDLRERCSWRPRRE